MKPYVDQKWEYVAVRLVPREQGATLGGELDPLRISFASDRLVYPMRLSRLAKSAQALGLYVLADHRMEPASPIGGADPEVTFAGTVTPEGSLAEFTGSAAPVFLTAIDQRFPDPSRIDGDHELRATAKDTPFRHVVYRDELLTAGGVPVWLLTVAGALVVVAGTAVTLLSVRRSRRRRHPSATTAPWRTDRGGAWDGVHAPNGARPARPAAALDRRPACCVLRPEFCVLNSGYGRSPAIRAASGRSPRARCSSRRSSD